MLICDNLCINFGEKEVLKNISFTLSDGQNLLILGENGAGKSTLALAMSALLPSHGHISLSKQELSQIAPKERSKLINYVAPKLSSHDEDITLMDYLLMGHFGRKKKFEPYFEDEIVGAMELLQDFELASLSKKRLHTLSSGEKQTAMILQAALQNSRLTIFDEPIANIDTAKTQTLFSLLLRDKPFSQKIVITHDLHFAFSLGFDILYLSGGKVDFFGKNKEFFSRSELNSRFGNTIQKNEFGVFTNYAKL
jgi:iron complex transport system ATP-binding protein